MDSHIARCLATRCGLLGLLLLALWGCSGTPSPQPVHDVSTADSIPDHAPFANLACVKCHDLDRPAPVVDTTTGAAMIHGGGQDCGQCHTAGAPSWRVFSAFSHAPTPESCLDCHSTARPAAVVNRMSHDYPGVGDCVACHAATAGVAWAGATYTHEPIPGDCAECHAGDRPTAVVNGFSHDSGGIGDCAACHHAVGVTWADGYFTHVPAPQKCADCHAGDRPAGLVGPAPQFDHAAQNGAGLGDCKSCHVVFSATQQDWSGGSFSHSPSPTSCIDCHLGARPVGTVGTPPFDHAKGGTGDCASCHVVTTAHPTEADWAGATFSHSPTPATCIDCHVGDRPTAPVGSPAFDHAIAGMGDCKSCHAVRSATKTDWTGGNFSHSPAPTTCIGCHLAQRPATATASGFDHVTMGGTGDCVGCHQNPGVTWAGATGAGFDHATLAPATRCDSCHEQKRPAAPYSVPWPGHATRPNQFFHSVMPTTDCKGCHLDPGGAWSGGTYAHSPEPTQCTVCHANQRLPGLVGPSGSQFDHALGGSGDCVECHRTSSRTSGWTSWVTDGYVHPATLTSCATCHEGRRPADTLHTTQGTGDCFACHKSPGVTWTGGIFSHSPRPTNCASCHAGDKPSAAIRTTGTSTDGRNYQNDYLHSLVTGDCVGCHAANAGVAWTGGTYSHSPAPASCTTCHTVTKPAAPVGTPPFNHAQAGLGDCKGCHLYPGQRWTGASAVPAVVVLTPPTGRTWPNVTAPHPTIDPAKSGLTCATCHGANTSAKIIAYDHAFPVAGSKCVYCHYSGQTETSASVEMKSHQSTSNTKDCTSSGCHRPKSYPTWRASTKTFGGGEWGSP